MSLSPISLLVLCTVLHFSVDGLCAAVLAKYAVNEPIYSNIAHYFGLYNVIAFGGQWLAGLVLDKYKRLVVPALAVVPVILAGGFAVRAGILFQAVSVALGNCLFHVAAGILVLERYEGFREPGIFVSSGAAGLGLGLHGFTGAVPFWAVCAAFTAITVFLVLKSPEQSSSRNAAALPRKNFLWLLLGAVLLLLCVTLRGFSGGSSRLPLHVMVMPCVFMLGKSAGGILCDAIGLRKTILAVFVMCFVGLQIPGSLGIITLTFAFNMTMPLTLRFLLRYFPDYPGLTFGLAAGCLLPGAFFRHYISIPPDVMAVVQFMSLFAAWFIWRREEPRSGLQSSPS